jgi:hypothetical protein
MLIDNLLASNIACRHFSGLPVYDLGNVEPVLQGLGVTDWGQERHSERDKTPPVSPVFVEYRWRESGPGGSDDWTLGVFIQAAPRDVVEAMVAGSNPKKDGTKLELPEGERQFYIVNQFEKLHGQRRPAGKPPSRLPMGRIIHNLMTWTVSLEGGTNARIQAFIPTDRDEKGQPVSPFGFDRMLSSYNDPYYPVGCPWIPFAMFGLLRAGRVAFDQVNGRHVLRKNS